MPASHLQILLTLVGGERHGYAIMKAARDAGESLGPGALYAALARLLAAGLIAEPDERPAHDVDDVRRRYYRITPHGRAALVLELDRLHATLERAAAAGIDRRAWRPSGPVRGRT